MCESGSTLKSAGLVVEEPPDRKSYWQPELSFGDGSIPICLTVEYASVIEGGISTP